MDYWIKNIPTAIHHVNYDELVSKQTSKTQHLIELLGLKWEDRCLFPESNKRQVTTASNIQIRKSVYSGSSEKWKLYTPHLDGIFDSLKKFE